MIRSRNSNGTVLKIHGLAGKGDHIYVAWKSIRDRCRNPRCKSYEYYGGRGITMHAPWIDNPISFRDYVLGNMGPRTDPKNSIDRIDNSGNYEPGNLRWATKIDQGNNMRSNRRIEYRGEVKTLQQWSRETGIGHGTIRYRLVMGKPLDVVFSCSDQRGNVNRRRVSACLA